MPDSFGLFAMKIDRDIKKKKQEIQKKYAQDILERTTLIKNTAIQLTYDNFTKEFSYAYLDIDINSIKEAIISIDIKKTIHGEEANITFDKTKIFFNKQNLRKDIVSFNQNEHFGNFRFSLEDDSIENNNYTRDFQDLNDSDLDIDTDSQDSAIKANLFANMQELRFNNFSWANKKNREGSFTPIDTVVQKATKGVNLSLTNEITKKINPVYEKRISGYLK